MNLKKDENDNMMNNHNRSMTYYSNLNDANFIISDNQKEDKPTSYIDYLPFNYCIAYIQINGDSLPSGFKGGDIIAIKRINNINLILPGETYLIVANSKSNK